MQPQDIGRIVGVGAPAVSPDGSTIAFVVARTDVEANKYRSAIWLAAADGSSPPYQFSAGEHGDANPVWAPDGRRLAFTSRRAKEKDGSQKGSLHVAPVSIPGEIVTLAERDEGFGQLAWSPDGTRLAFASREPTEKEDDDRARPSRKIDRLFSRLDSEGWIIDRPTLLFVVPVDGSAPPRAVTAGPFEDGSPTWAPDGHRLAFVSARHDDWDLTDENDIYLVDVDGPLGDDGAPPVPVRLTATDRSFALPSWSPEDADRIAVLHYESAVQALFADVALVDATSGGVTILTGELDRNCAPYPGQQPPVRVGGDLLFSIEDHGAVHVYRVAVDGSGEPQLVIGGPRCVNSFDSVGGTLAFVAADATSLPELFVLDADGTERQLTHVGATFLAEVPPRPSERFVVPTADGAGEIDAWIVVPDGVDPHGSETIPTLVNVHGGPHTQYSERWFDEFQLWAGAGYAVVFLNPRGSTDQTHDWARAIRSPQAKVDPGSGWGGVDYDDVIAVVDAAIARYGCVDADRIGIMGGSYGGYMTSWAIGHTDRFQAAVSERAVNNLMTLETASDAAGFFRFNLGVSHLDAEPEYRERSPITYVREITTPVLIIHSEQDLRCPIEQADQLFVALRLLGREFEYHRFPAESHELTRAGSPKHRIERAQLIIDWFDRHLKEPASQPLPSSP